MDQIAVVCALVILAFLSVTLNVIALCLIKRKKAFCEKPSSRLILNLLATHLFQAILVLPLYAGKKMKVEDLEWARFFSNGFRVSYFISFYVVVFSALAITIERFLAIYLLNSYKIYVNIKNISMVIIIIWIYVTLLCLIPFIPEETPAVVSTDICAANSTIHINETIKNINSTQTDNTNCTTVNMKWKTNNFYIYNPQEEWTVFMLFANAALPLLIIIMCYVYIIYRLRRLIVSKDVERNKRFNHITYLSIVLISIYCVLWTPTIIYYTILSVCDKTCFPENWDGSFTESHVSFIIKYQAFMNNLLSPIIYCYFAPSLNN